MKTSDADRDRQPWEQYNPFLETVAPGPTDEELVAEAQTGREEALEELGDAGDSDQECH